MEIIIAMTFLLIFAISIFFFTEYRRNKSVTSYDKQKGNNFNSNHGVIVRKNIDTSSAPRYFSTSRNNDSTDDLYHNHLHRQIWWSSISSSDSSSHSHNDCGSSSSYDSSSSSCDSSGGSGGSDL
jgi:uncharacterized membrane protein YgcG